ncbi:type IV pilus modification protein PilV [Endozoicomonas sp. G2_2]|uniref:type IV pilus modification protein PilV n=1 Tax=Endozoicomonas sp. G2_2 TaxID=2821092 RepID=UPI001ADA0614|nr:type IV pilus modification protein PilV [Endozoicomonas sp. G2_2]
MTRLDSDEGAMLEHGFTLLEALVALVVISIGLLGLLGLQTVSLVNTQNSEARSLASIGADDIADRIRANPAGAGDGHYEDIVSPYDPEGSSVPGDCGSGCSPEDMAERDAWEWGQSLHQMFRAQGYVACETPGETSADPCRAYAITIAWNEREAPAANGASNGTDSLHNCDREELEFNQCFITVVRP